MQFYMLISNLRFILRENQVDGRIFECKAILIYGAKRFDISIGNDYPNDKPRCSFLLALIWYKNVYYIIYLLGR
jgi:hypothetical protein